MSVIPKVRFLDRTTGPHIFTLIMMTSLTALAMNIFLPSLPSMAVHFDTTAGVIGLSVGLYLAASAAIQIVSGPISDTIGRRPVSLASTGIFVAVSVACIYAPNATAFLLARMVQAASAAGMVLSRAVVRDMVPEEHAGPMIAYVTMGTAVVPMLGPALGGLLDQYLTWRASFWVLAGLGLATLALTWFDQGETAPTREKGGTGKAGAGEYGELLRSPRFWGYCLSAATSVGIFYAYLGGAPFVGSQVFGLEPQVLGVLFGAPAVGYFLGNFLTGRYSARVGLNRMIVLGMTIAGTGTALAMAISALGYGTAASFFGVMIIVGLGNGMSIPNATAGMLSVRPRLAGTASGLGAAIMIGGGAGLSALAGWLITEESGELPLLGLMLLSALAGLVTMFYVMRRERRLGLTPQ